VKNRTLLIFALLPIFILVAIVSVGPILYNIYISLTNMSLYHYADYEFIGLGNYQVLFTSPVSDFMRITIWNVSYCLLAVILSFIIGVAAAEALPAIPGPVTRIARPLLILPWVIPAFITILIWKGFFDYQFGPLNTLLGALGLPKAPWLIDPAFAKVSIIIVSVWLGVPFMMVTASGVIQTLPKGIFEAARLDGAGRLTTFRSFTVPLVFRRMFPVLIMGFSASFNNFTVIYLLTSGGPTYPESIGGAGATDILLSYIFKLTLSSRRYGLAAAYAVFLFIAIGTFTLLNAWWMRRGREEVF
jgi:arabinogalactan oligomer/maltooligosaccharide transport system permease protein